MWSATTLAPSFSALEADVAAQFAPVRGIERSQLGADWHRYAVSLVTAASSTSAVGTLMRRYRKAAVVRRGKLEHFRVATPVDLSWEAQAACFLRFAACADSRGVWHGRKVSGCGER